MSHAAITRLAGCLQVFSDGIGLSPEWCAQQQMSNALGMIRSRHRQQPRIAERSRILDTVTRYLHTGQVQRPEQIFDICRGAAWLDEAGGGLLADRQLRRRLFVLAETVTGRSRRLKAFRGLLYAYWCFPVHDAATPVEAIEGWKELRVWLKQRYAEIGQHPSRKPTWFTILGAYLHLLEDNPCAPYASSLLRGSLDTLQQAIDSLSIPIGSWLMSEAVMAQISEAAQCQDQVFVTLLPQLMRVATGEAGIRVSDEVARRAIAGLVMRYARQIENEPHEELFVLAIERIGNPWWQQSAWDAGVRDETGMPCSLSREMVGSWRKDKVIGEFFLDRGQDASRCEFWLRYATFIQGISLAAPWQDGKDRALLMRMGEFLLIVPHNADRPINVYPWKALLSKGGGALLDMDLVDASRSQAVLDQCKPATRLSQLNASECEKALHGLLFSKGVARLNPSKPG